MPVTVTVSAFFAGAFLALGVVVVVVVVVVVAGAAAGAAGAAGATAGAAGAAGAAGLACWAATSIGAAKKAAITRMDTTLFIFSSFFSVFLP